MAASLAGLAVGFARFAAGLAACFGGLASSLAAVRRRFARLGLGTLAQ